MTSSNSEFLKSALQAGALIRFRRRFEANKVCGYVVEVGAKFFVLALVSDRIRYDGYECFRIADVVKPTLDQNAPFIEAALEARGETRSECRLDVTNLESLLSSAGAAFPLVAIHQEVIDPGVCWIGRVMRVRRGHLSLLEIGPDASWDEEPCDYRLADITRVNFDGDYERALHLVGGSPA